MLSEAQAVDLLTGIVSSLHCAQKMQQDAVALFRQKRFASACILGTIALEHVGQTSWLVGRFLELQQGKRCSWDSLRRIVKRDHEKMIADGLSTLEFGLPKLYEKSKELEELWETVKKVMNRAPAKFLKLREKAQYVKPADGPNKWNYPLDLTREEVHDLLLNVGNNYRTLLFNLLQIKPVSGRIGAMGLRNALEDPRGIWPPPEGKF